VPSGGIVVNFREGYYPVSTTCVFDNQDSGEAGSPVVYTGYEDEQAVFDGNVNLNSSAFIATTSTDAEILHANAVGKVYVQTISDKSLITALKSGASLVMDNKLMTLSRFPNIGFATIDNSTVNSSIETVGTKGSMTSPFGASFKLIDKIDAKKWSNEIARTQNVVTKGYVSADWLIEGNRIYSVSDDGTMRVTNGSAYGMAGRDRANRIYAYRILCELDQPGEWFFDATDNRLFIYPYSSLTPETKIGVALGAGLATVSNAQYINFEKMTIQNIGKGASGIAALNFESGNNYKVAGVTFKNILQIVACSFKENVFNSTILSCDFFDNNNCTSLYGGSFTSTGTIVEGNNSIENCHFTQIYSIGLYGKVCNMKGVHNTFKNNLVHNSNGQPITFSGIDHILELNEAFNVGIEEGDGGAFYTDADIMSYGNRLRYNFVHHIMCVPQLVGRAAFFSDDFDGGELYHENVFYKGGSVAVKMNKGAGHTISKNVMLDGYHGIRENLGNSSHYNLCMEYINSTNGRVPTSKDKENYMGRMLQNAGVANWEDGLSEENWYSKIEPFWLSRYPYFDLVMKAYSNNNEMNAYQCRFYDNLFYGNDKEVVTSGSVAAVKGSIAIDGLDIFENPQNLNFKFKNPAAFEAKIPFENIGLYLDKYRCAIPNKDDYRRTVKQHFEHLASYTNDPFDPATINGRLYYNTGKMVMSMVPCSNAEVYKQTDYFFDLGTTTSALWPGADRISNITTRGTYGWTNTDGLMAVDRGTAGGANTINRDLVYSSLAKTFAVSVPNGTYKVLITFGDATVNHDKMLVKAEGQTMLSDINTTAGEFFNKTFEVDVQDNELSLEFSDAGGAEPNWAITRLKVDLIKLAPAPRAPEVRFVSPQSGDEFPYPSDISVTVHASDIDGTIANVKLYINDQFVRQENVAPYEWGMTNQNDPLLQNLAPGSYTLKALAEDNSGLTSASSLVITVKENPSTFINNQSEMSGLKIFPNPVEDILYIESIEEIKYIKLSTTKGLTVLSIPVAAKAYSLNTSTLNPGIYILGIELTDGRQNVVKLFK